MSTPTSAPGNRGTAGQATLPNALEGQIEEICRDMALQVKRMRQLHEQADELRTTFRRWARPRGTDATPTHSRVVRRAK